MREFKWRLRVRSYEGDAWGLVPTSGVLRYLEQSAILAAADAGYGREFHETNKSAWVVRRIKLITHTPARQGDEIEIATWISHFARVRGGREYTVSDAASGERRYTAFAEWVYMNRETFTPLVVPREAAVDFDVPGAPVQNYDTRAVEPNCSLTFEAGRTVEWHEIDSQGHVNNAVYADWLDDALRAGLETLGLSTEELRQRGLHLRAESTGLSYKQAAMPGDRLRIATHITGIEGRVCGVEQAVTRGGEEQVLAAESIYGWRDAARHAWDPPAGWDALRKG